MTLPLPEVPSGPARVPCPCCGRGVTVTSTGRVAAHGYTQVGGGSIGGCPAAGLTLTQARARLAAGGGA